MQDDRMKYGTDFTSVKVHQSPGGNSSINLAWEEPARRKAAPAQQHGSKGQSWDPVPAAYDRVAPRNIPRPQPQGRAAYEEPQPRGYVDQRGQPAQPYRAYQDPEPAFRDDLPWRDDPRQQERYEQPRGNPRGYDQPREQRGYDQPREQRGYEDRGYADQRAYEQRGYEQRDMRPRGDEERQPARGRMDRPGQGNTRAKDEFVPRYEQRPPQDPGNVHTSVKVKEPPGGRSHFTFGLNGRLETTKEIVAEKRRTSHMFVDFERTATMEGSEDRYVFLVEWYDPPADLVRKYQLIYFTLDRTIEMIDLKNRRVFLKRMQAPGVALSDLFLGNTITIYARQLKIVEYADAYTRMKFENRKSRTFGMIKPDAYQHIGKILDSILSSGFKITRLKMHRFTLAQAQTFYSEHQGKNFFNELVAFMSSDVVVGMELVSDNAVSAWRELIGPTNSLTARVDRPNSIRARFGTDGSKNAVHGSDSQSSATREIDYFFSLPGNSAVLNNCTCAIVKPHALQDAGRVVDSIIEEGFEVSAMQMFIIDKPSAEEFLEVYKGVLPEYSQMVEELTSGPALVMEVRQESAVQSFREVVGPIDPEEARRLRPNSLRAKFGADRTHNALHCTDLPEDGVLEVEYFFQILAHK